SPENGTLIFQDDFTDPKSGWFIYKADSTKGGAYEQGAYSVWAVGSNTVIALNPKTRQQLKNFSAEVDLRETSSIRGAVMGIIYRLDNAGTYYRFAITDNRSFYVGRKSALGIEEEVYPQTPSDIIKPADEYNRLKVVCIGENQDFYINGTKLATLTDNTSLKGELGISFSNWAISENYTFTNFKLYNLK
ncbi:MAG: hypothetical protein NTZ34_05905, partial [Chloroflexi bacterium]|nr:hypothetical protein [Chloroflexota bacterium]